ncbi:MAG: transcriptional repressor LexA [Patescibacteria group bacterium]|jgi:repressor LexA
MTENITKKQKEILDYITEFISVNGYSPSYREMADYFGLSSPATIFEHIKGLEDKGFIKAEERKARSIKIFKEKKKEIPALELPLVGLIAAGEPIEAIEERETISIPVGLVDSINSFVLKVKGESMIGEGIFDGDYVVCERNYYPKNGDVVVALLNNEYATLKKYFREKTRIRLQPANPNMKPIFSKNPVIQGIVKAIFRKY